MGVTERVSEIRTTLLIFKSYANLPNQTANNENDLQWFAINVIEML